MTLKRDENFVTVIGGVSSTDSVTPLDSVIDSLTGRLLVAITATSSIVGTLPASPAPRDGNFVPVCMGVSDATGLPLPVMMDNRNSLIYCDVLVV